MEKKNNNAIEINSLYKMYNVLGKDSDVFDSLKKVSEELIDDFKKNINVVSDKEINIIFNYDNTFFMSFANNDGEPYSDVVKGMSLTKDKDGNVNISLMKGANIIIEEMSVNDLVEKLSA